MMDMHPSDLTLNDYVDGALTVAERASVDGHLVDCESCRQLVDDFREIRQSASGLGAIEPPARVWTRIEQSVTELKASDQSSARIALPRHAARPGAGGVGLAFGSWQLAGALLAVAALVMAVFLGFRIGRSRGPDPASAAMQADGAPSAQSIEAELQQAEEHYQKAIAGLEQVASANSGVFDAATAATLQKNLSVVDQAISESRAALRAQPNSQPAQASLLDSFKAKLALLQETVSLINEMRKGDDAAAARIVSGIKRGT